MEFRLQYPSLPKKNQPSRYSNRKVLIIFFLRVLNAIFSKTRSVCTAYRVSLLQYLASLEVSV